MIKEVLLYWAGVAITSGICQLNSSDYVNVSLCILAGVPLVYGIEYVTWTKKVIRMIEGYDD